MKVSLERERGRKRGKERKKERREGKEKKKRSHFVLYEICTPKNRLGPFNISAVPVAHAFVTTKIQTLRVIGRNIHSTPVSQ